MNYSVLLLIVIVAGMLNGFYVFPIKKNSAENNVLWAIFSLLAFIVVPAVFLAYFFYYHQIQLTINELLWIVFSGIIYGFGVFFVAKSMGYIGVGIPFGISLAFGTVSGSIFSSVVLHKFTQNITPTILLSYLFFLLSIGLYTFAVFIRDGKGKSDKSWGMGILFCLLGSLLQASQGACLSYFSNLIKSNGDLVLAQFVPWALILIPCGVIFLFSITLQMNLRIIVKSLHSPRCFLWGMYMTMVYIISVFIYTVVNSHAELFSERYFWVAFMGGIVLGSSLCSFLKREWRACALKGLLLNIVGVIILISSIVLMCYASQ